MKNASNKKQGVLLPVLRAAFPVTIPIFAGFWFLGISYGILMKVNGFSFLYPMLMALTIFGGSLEFVAASLLMGAFAPIETLMVTLMIQARHLFYGISMLEKYKNTGKKKLYLIFGMCDESFSINYSADIPENIDKGWFMFFVTLFDHIYWIIGSTVGAIFGTLINFSTEGIDFVMTSMFVVIFINQWQKDKNHLSAIYGISISLICLVLFGPDNFIIPSMIGIFLALTVSRKYLEKKAGVIYDL